MSFKKILKIPDLPATMPATDLDMAPAHSMTRLWQTKPKEAYRHARDA